MAQTVGDFFWARMKEWGVRTMFGYPGDGINGQLGPEPGGRRRPVRPGAPRGDGGLHGLRLREVHGGYHAEVETPLKIAGPVSDPWGLRARAIPTDRTR